MSRGIFGWLLLMSLSGGTLGAAAVLGSMPAAISVSSLPLEESKPLLTASLALSPSPLTLVFVGDLMLDRGVAAAVREFGYGDFNWLFEEAASLKKFDFLIGNLEGPISARGEDQGYRYSFRMTPRVAPALRQAGFDVLTIANNHIGDWGREALADTVSLLRQNGLAPVGGGLNYAEAAAPAVFEKGDGRVGFLAFNDVKPESWLATEEAAGVLSARDRGRLTLIKEAAAIVDLLAVSYHFGEEYQTEPTERQRWLARSSIDAGADLVIGHHPHVVQSLERYRNGLIAYSLGNFIFDQNFSEATMRGLVLIVRWSPSGRFDFETRTVELDDGLRPQLTGEA